MSVSARLVETRRPFFILTLASFYWFAPTLIGDQAFFARDVLNLYWSTRETAAQALRSGHLPLWDPYSQSGIPLYANIHAGVLYPPYLLHLFLPFPRAYASFLFLHHLWGGFGAYVLARRFGISRLSSVASGLTFQFSGCILGMANAGPLMAGASFVPWVLAALLAHRSLLLKSLWVSGLLALQIYAGDTQAILYSLLGAMFLIVWRTDRREIFFCLCFGGLGALFLGAAELLPAYRLLQQSDRAVWNSAFLQEFAFHPGRLVESIFSLPFGAYASDRDFWGGFLVKGPGQAKWPFVLSGYVGAVGMTAVIVASKRDRRTGFALCLALVGIDFALGPRGLLGRWILPLPPFQFFRYPEKYLFLFVLGFTLCVGLALDVLRAQGRPRLWRLGVVASFWFFTTAAASSALLFPAPIQGWTGGILEALGVHRVSASEALSTILPSLLQSGLLGLLLVSLLGVMNRIPKHAWGALFVALLATDVLLSSVAMRITAPIELYALSSPLIPSMGSNSPVQPFRFLREDGLQRPAYHLASREQYVEVRAWDLETLRGDTAGPFHLEDVRGYGASFSLRRWKELAVSLYTQPERLSALWNGCLLLGQYAHSSFDGKPGLLRVAEFPPLAVALYKNTACLPRFHSINQVIASSNLEEAIQQVALPSFDPVHQAISESGPSRTFAEAVVVPLRFEPSLAEAEIQVNGPLGFLVFATSYYPGWRAFIDGVPAEPEIVNAAQMGIPVPAGKHHIRFQFFVPELRLALGLTLAGAAAHLLALIGLKRSAPRS